MKIDLQTLLKIGRAHPELTVLEYAGSTVETTKELKRETDRERIKTKRKASDTERHDATPSDKPTNRGDMERQLYSRAQQICGRNVNGMVAILLKHHHYQLEPVDDVLTRAGETADPRAFVAAQCKKVKNGTGPSLMDAFDRLDDRAASGSGGAGAPLHDLTPGSH